MSRPFVADLRSRAATIELGEAESERLTIRVQAAELWDAVRIATPPSLPVVVVKVRALEALHPTVDAHEDFVLKLGGIEILDENASLAEAGVRDGSTLLLMYRRRRPIR